MTHKPGYEELDRRVQELEKEILIRTQAEEGLRESEKRYRSLVETSSDWLWEIDANGRYTYVNSAVRKILGYAPEEVVGRTPFDLMPEEEARRVGAIFVQIATERRPFSLLENVNLHRDGRRVVLETSGVTVFGLDGEFMGYRGIDRDITERKRAEETLAQSVSLLAATIESTADGILVVDRAGKITSSNEKFKQMWHIPDEVIASNDDDRTLAFVLDQLSNPDEFITGVKELYGRPEAESLDIINFKCGSIFERYSRPQYIDNQVVGRVWSFRDITERKRMEAEKARLVARNQHLQKAESLGRMAGAIAHLFNNQLGVVIGNLELALMDLSEDGVIRRENLTEAILAARRSSEISGLLLTYLGQSKGNSEPLDLSELCRQKLPMLQEAMPECISVETNLLSSGPVVRSNANQIHQVLTHLITNGWESIGHSTGTVTLATRIISASEIPKSHLVPIGWKPETDVFACLEVTDTGCGITEEDLDKIFDPFFTTKFTGRGLGLAVVLGIVKTWGGAIGVETKKNHGSIFRVFLPLLTDELPLPAKKATEAHPTELGGKVLLVEDLDMLRNMAEAMLKRLGFEVLAASGGAEAVKLLRENPDRIRCVITDLSMPGMDGWETLAALREIRPNIPVILVSGYDEARAMTGNYPERPQIFLQKPYSIGDLQVAIDTALKKPVSTR